jgi:hypothetical protein
MKRLLMLWKNRNNPRLILLNDIAWVVTEGSAEIVVHGKIDSNLSMEFTRRVMKPSKDDECPWEEHYMGIGIELTASVKNYLIRMTTKH